MCYYYFSVVQQVQIQRRNYGSLTDAVIVISEQERWISTKHSSERKPNIIFLLMIKVDDGFSKDNFPEKRVGHHRQYHGYWRTNEV